MHAKTPATISHKSTYSDVHYGVLLHAIHYCLFPGSVDLRQMTFYEAAVVCFS